MNILKDALLKAGLKPSPEPAKPSDPKLQNQRKYVPEKKLTDSVAHQKWRNFCEECQQICPDVEFYEHRNPTTEAEWICLRCADQLKIPDTCRKTAQSEAYSKRLFRRQYGPTVNQVASHTNSRK
jgi:AraC-like DNA-binding protein